MRYAPFITFFIHVNNKYVLIFYQYWHKFGATSQFKGVHDKIGQIAKYVYSMLEKYGDVDARAYTAYMFLNVLLDNLKKPSRYTSDLLEDKWKKPHTAATRYINLYAASSAADTVGRDPAKVNMVLDRSLMWGARKVPGCQSAYCFKTGNFNMRNADGSTKVRNMMVTPYPCPSQSCACATSHIVHRPEFAELPLCENVLLMGREHRAFWNVTLQKRPTGEAVENIEAIALPAVDEEAVAADEEPGNIDVLDRVVSYLENMFSEANFIAPYQA